MRGIVALIVLIVAVVTSMPVVAETPIKLPDCVDALEQIVVLRMPVPVYIEEDRFHRDITASERRLELTRLTKIVRSSCGKDPKVREQQDIDAHQLYIARSPECRFVWARYAAMMTPGLGFTREEIEHHKVLMKEKCPATDLDHHWLIENTETVNDPDLVPASHPQ
jgi:hypothetical protein